MLEEDEDPTAPASLINAQVEPLAVGVHARRLGGEPTCRQSVGGCRHASSENENGTYTNDRGGRFPKFFPKALRWLPAKPSEV
ncbi:hypothetical protein D3C85_1190190 [compost metagenome]